MTGPAVARTDAQGKLVRAIQACRRQVAGLEEEGAWRGFLERHAGKRGLREMSGAELGKVLDALHASGAPRRGPKRTDDDPQLRMIRGLWLELADLGAVRSREETAIAGFVARQTGVEALQWLDSHGANKVIEALKRWRDRVAAQLASDMEDPSASAHAIWDKLHELGAIEQPTLELDMWAYTVTGKAAFMWFEEADWRRLLVRLRGWLHTASKGARA